MNNKIVKEALIIVLLILVILFAVGILFYDCMSADVDKVVSVEYETDSNVNEVLTEIEANSGVDVKNSNSNSLLKSYSINAEDLSIYASENSYESGKKDPFAESSETIDSFVTTTTKGGTATNSQTSNKITKTEDEKENKTTNPPVNTVTSAGTKTESKDKVVNNTVVNNVKNSSSTTGTFFENKNSK